MNRRLKSVAFGLIGGAAGTFVIGQTMARLKKLQSEEDKGIEKQLTPEPPTDVLAERIVSEDNKPEVSRVIHWGYGIFWGGVYGLLREEYPVVAKGAALPFGAALTLFGEGLMLPAMGLTAPAHKYPASTLGRDITAHWAYAATTEAVCGLLKRAERLLSKEERRTNVDLRRAS